MDKGKGDHNSKQSVAAKSLVEQWKEVSYEGQMVKFGKIMDGDPTKVTPINAPDGIIFQHILDIELYNFVPYVCTTTYSQITALLKVFNTPKVQGGSQFKIQLHMPQDVPFSIFRNLFNVDFNAIFPQPLKVCTVYEPSKPLCFVIIVHFPSLMNIESLKQARLLLTRIVLMRWSEYASCKSTE